MSSHLYRLNGPRLVLWGCLIWYLVVLGRYFDPSPLLWINSLAISAIIGTAFYWGIARGAEAPVTLETGQVFGLYLIPFCISSFTALIKDRGFILVFHPALRENLISLALVSGFVTVALSLQRLAADAPTPPRVEPPRRNTVTFAQSAVARRADGASAAGVEPVRASSNRNP